ncbi:hypothetical protein HOC35_04945 [Candidatus Woesearchaeota archaeon]|nr:hypothetical protein [Candidatus Woesearchaeota archaeon]
MANIGLPFEVKRYLGCGVHGSVFLIDHEGEDTALKIAHPYDSTDIAYFVEKLEKEHSYLQRLKGIKGIPQPIELISDVEGTYEELGLDKCGRPWQDVVPKYDAHMGISHKNKPYFAGGFILDYVPDAKTFHSIPPNTLTHDFFEQLAWIYIQAIGRGIHPAFDATVLVSNNNPFIVDWAFALEIGPVQKGKEIVYRSTDLDPVRDMINYHMRNTN